MIEESVYLYADTLKLEGILTYDEDALPSSAILLCAPHPNLGGDMDNNVITSIARVSADMGFLSLRFNYRGVGNSESHEKDIVQKFHYWEESLHGRNLMDAVTDTQAALDFLLSQIAVHDRIFVAGYSFGALVGMKMGTESSRVLAFASISTPFGRYNLDFLSHCNAAAHCSQKATGFFSAALRILSRFLADETIAFAANFFDGANTRFSVRTEDMSCCLFISFSLENTNIFFRTHKEFFENKRVYKQQIYYCFPIVFYCFFISFSTFLRCFRQTNLSLYAMDCTQSPQPVQVLLHYTFRTMRISLPA